MLQSPHTASYDLRLSSDAISSFAHPHQNLSAISAAAMASSTSDAAATVAASGTMMPGERFSYTRNQLEILNALFRAIPYPNQQQKQQIAKRVGISLTQCKIWFQNRRRKGIMAKKGTLSKSQLSVLHIELMQVPKRVADEIIEDVRRFDGIPQSMPTVFKDGVPVGNLVAKTTSTSTPLNGAVLSGSGLNAAPKVENRQKRSRDDDGEDDSGAPTTKACKNESSASISTLPTDASIAGSASKSSLTKARPPALTAYGVSSSSSLYNPSVAATAAVPPFSFPSARGASPSFYPSLTSLTPLHLPTTPAHNLRSSFAAATPYDPYYSPSSVAARAEYNKKFTAYLDSFKRYSSLSHDGYHQLLRNLPNCSGSYTDATYNTKVAPPNMCVTALPLKTEAAPTAINPSADAAMGSGVPQKQEVRQHQEQYQEQQQRDLQKEPSREIDVDGAPPSPCVSVVSSESEDSTWQDSTYSEQGNSTEQCGNNEQGSSDEQDNSNERRGDGDEDLLHAVDIDSNLVDGVDDSTASMAPQINKGDNGKDDFSSSPLSDFSEGAPIWNTAPTAPQATAATGFQFHPYHQPQQLHHQQYPQLPRYPQPPSNTPIMFPMPYAPSADIHSSYGGLTSPTLSPLPSAATFFGGAGNFGCGNVVSNDIDNYARTIDTPPLSATLPPTYDDETPFSQQHQSLSPQALQQHLQQISSFPSHNPSGMTSAVTSQSIPFYHPHLSPSNRSPMASVPAAESLGMAYGMPFQFSPTSQLF